jgi:predicted metal-dependent peptidase
MKPDLKISRAVTKLAFNQPFFGSCLMQLRLEEKAEIPTMCTDSKHIWWNAKFVEELSEEEVQFVLAHEVMHVLLKHCKPHLGKDPKLCNVAMDYVINAQLRDCGFS